MKPSLWGGALIVPLVWVPLACGGATFTTGNDSGSSSSGGGSSSSGGSSTSSSGGSGGGSGGGSSGSSGGGSSTSSGGGSSSSSGGHGSSSGGTGSSSGVCTSGCADSGPAPLCPPDPPASKTSCSPTGLDCEYGSNPVQGCDTVSTCNGTWTTTAPTDTKCSPTLGAGCPLTFEGVPQGSSCPSDGLICNYPRGRCACEVYTGGPILLVDSSVQGHWVCQDPATPGCPIPRAPLGSACTQNGVSCDYGTCSVPGGTAEICQNNRWEEAVFACAVVAGAQSSP
jgi:hypothetical protein